MAAGRTLVDVQVWQLTLWVNEEEIELIIHQAKKFCKDTDTCYGVEAIDVVVREKYKKELFDDPLEQYIVTSTSRIDITSNGSYTWSMEVVDSILALETFLLKGNEN